MVSPKKKVISIMPPVQKGIWYVGNAPADSSHHRRTHTEFYSVYDSLQDGYIIGYNNQRFAMDLSKLGKEGRKANNGGKYNSDYNDYGENIVGVADGEVVAVMDFIPDNPNPLYRKSNWEIDSICGNYIALNIGDNLIALYAHIKPNSIRVKVGDVIKKGTVIGQIGNSGKSSGAHLHFQISKFKVPYKESGNSFLSEGISFVFDNYISYSWQTGFDWHNVNDTDSLKFLNPQEIKNRLPYFNEIIEIK
jgi:murein DD-endopeptidase MepM/ murein hydrolase activator NlpD